MKKNAFSKMIAAFMALIMTLGVFAALPSVRFSSVQAEGNDEFPEIHYRTEEGTQVALGKDAYLTEDGTYTIDLSAYTVGAPVIKERTVKVPADYVLVIDASSSMKDTYSCGYHQDGRHTWHTMHHSSVTAAANAFIDELKADSTTFENPEWNLDSRVAVVTYATGDHYWNSTSMQYNGTGIYKTEKGADNATFYRYANPSEGQHLASEIYDDAFMSVLDEYNEAQTAINDIELSAYTAMHLGMEMAKNIIEETAAKTTDSQDDHYNKYYDQDAQEWKVRPKVVVLFTDGVSGQFASSSKSAMESILHANAIKSTGAKIYTVGLVSNTMFTQQCWCWAEKLSGLRPGTDIPANNESIPVYGNNDHHSMGEFQVSDYTYEEFTNQNTTVIKNMNGEYFAGLQKLKTDLGLSSDEEAMKKFVELQKNQYRIMGLTRGFLYKDILMAISSEYDQVTVSNEDDKQNPNNNGRNSEWPMYIMDSRDSAWPDGTLKYWYSAAPALDLKVDGQRIGARYNAVMTGVLNGQPTVGTNYSSNDAIWKKLYQTTTEKLLTYNPVFNRYEEMDVEVPVVTQEAGYVGGVRVGYEYAVNPDLKYYIPLENAYDLLGGSGEENIQKLISAFKQIQEFSVSEYLGTNANTGLARLSAITDKISENFVVPENLEIGKNIKIWLVPVDNAAMKADPSNDGVNVSKWHFGTPQDRTASVVLLDSTITTDAQIESELYYGQGTFKGGVKYDPETRTFTIVGFRWANGSWYCKYDPDSGNYSGWKMVVRISGLTAKDDVVPANSIPTNDKLFSGMAQNWRDTRPATLQTVNGTERLLFPEPTVKIRERRIVYDYGFKLTYNVSGFFADEGETNDVAQLLSIDYMYNSHPRNDIGEIAYHTEYPYNGARGRDIYGNPITYGTDIDHDKDGFKIGFENGIGYFEPHTISHRDYKVAALLELNGTQKDVFGADIARYEWCKLVALPATNVLYEAEQGVTASNLNGNFVSYTNSTFASSGSWSVEGSFDASSTQEHYNRLYGYDPVYNGKLNCDANGASMMVTVNSALYDAVKAKTATWPVAKFSFKGSGFSFTSRCGIDTGIFIVDVVPHGLDQKYNNTTNHPAPEGYTPVEGDNYHTLVNTRYYGGSETPDGSALLHQIPVFRRGHMPYQDYDVYLTPVYYPAWANDPTQNVSTRSGEEVSMRLDKLIPGVGDIEYTITNAVESAEGEATRANLPSFTSYIDTVRIYHPLGAKVHAKDTDAVEYYHAHEMNAKYVETRALLINSIQNLNQGGNGGNIAGAIFLDYGPVAEGGNQHFNANDPSTYSISNYVKFGPNNEMYLSGMNEGIGKLEVINATAGSEQSGEPAANAFDGDNNTLWHTAYSINATAEERYITAELSAPTIVSRYEYQPRITGNSNGRVNEYRISVSMDGENWTVAATGSWANDGALKTVEFDTPVEAKFVKLEGVTTYGSVASQTNNFMSAAEIGIFGKTDSLGGSFTFAIANPGQVTNLHLSMKAHESDQPAYVTVKFLAKKGGSYSVIQGAQNNFEVNSTTEMYYDLLKGLTDAQRASIAGISIECAGDVTLSIVNLKIVYKDGYVETSEIGSVNPNIVTNLETVEFANAIAFGVKGDANGDNLADMADALLIMRKSLGSDIEFGISATYLSDVNEDGEIDLTDALSTMRLALN